MGNPPSYSQLQSDNRVFQPEVMKTIESKLEELNPELRKLSLQIHGENTCVTFKLGIHCYC
jgi:hypothetical protein